MKKLLLIIAAVMCLGFATQAEAGGRRFVIRDRAVFVPSTRIVQDRFGRQFIVRGNRAFVIDDGRRFFVDDFRFRRGVRFGFFIGR